METPVDPTETPPSNTPKSVDFHETFKTHMQTEHSIFMILENLHLRLKDLEDKVCPK